MTNMEYLYLSALMYLMRLSSVIKTASIKLTNYNEEDFHEYRVDTSH